jgi:hypothetical protein
MTTIEPGFTFRHRSAEGTNGVTVKAAHRDRGYWLCQWTSGPRVGATEVFSEAVILDHAGLSRWS